MKYKTNPIDNSPATIIKTGVETCSKTIQGLLKALKFVEAKFLKRPESHPLHSKI